MRVIFLSVGQGDCTVLAYGSEAILVDSGPKADVAERVILRRLREEGITNVRGLLLTHDDTDHTAGSATLARAFPTMPIWIGPGSRITVRGQVKRLGAQQRMTLGPYEMIIRFPFFAGPEDNPRSSLIGVTVNGSTLALTGDSPTGKEEGVIDLLPRGAEIYKAGHHGSASSSSARLLRALQPKIVVVSCGVDNRYRHPHPSVLKRIGDAEARVLRTDLDGDVFAVPSGGGWEIRTAPAMALGAEPSRRRG